ncbi:MAG: hypothetical protein IT233_13690 [Bacteroidia bacterium]|nr:hypothetical protein [Bacteroidia bacterium]
MRSQKILYPVYGTVFLTACIVSFLHFSPVFHFDLHSDMVIPVLQAYDFNWRTDLYYWGQDRLGSLLPALAHLFRWLPVHTVWLVSVLQWMLSAAALWLLTDKLRPLFLRLLFAVAWLMPFPFFSWNLLVGQPYTAQFFLIGLSFFFLYRYREFRGHALKKSFLLGCSLFSWMLSVWTNDMSVVILPLFLLFILQPSLDMGKEGTSTVFRFRIPFEMSRSDIAASFVALLAGVFFLLFAKSQAYQFKYTVYRVSDISVVTDGLFQLFNEVTRAFAFRVFNILVSVHAWLLLLILGLTFLSGRVKNESFPLSNLLLFSSVLTFFALLFSEWVSLNSFQARYFVVPYYLLLLGIFFRICCMQAGRIRLAATIALTAAVLLSAVDSLIHYPWAATGDKHLSFAEHRVITTRLDSGAVLGTYWNSYLLSAGDPGKITGTPKEHEPIRNYDRMWAASKMKRIYLVKNNWLDSFPDTLTQFGRQLYRNGAPFRFEYLELCEYR